MRTILAIFCVLMALFAGGCVVILLPGIGGRGGEFFFVFALFPAAATALNILVLAIIFGKAKPQREPFYFLSAFDLVLAVVIASLWLVIFPSPVIERLIATLVILALLAKAVLQLAASRGLKVRGSAEPPTEG